MPGPTKLQPVAKVGDLADGAMMSVKVESTDILLARIGDSYFAIDAWCSHEAGYLLHGALHADLCEVECPVHEGSFDLRTGEATMPPAEDSVPAFAVKVQGDDILVGPKGDA